MQKFRKPSPKLPLEIAKFGQGSNSTIVVIRHTDRTTWAQVEKIPGTMVIVIGGQKAKKEIRKLVDITNYPDAGVPRHELPEVGSKTHTNIRAELGVTKAGRPTDR